MAWAAITGLTRASDRQQVGASGPVQSNEIETGIRAPLL
jgi:hypothetical protein